LCAEDAERDFMPQSGTLGLWRPPPRLRVEHALHSGAEITPHYDSMIAKIVSHGTTRDEARRKLIAGLTDTVALGVRTNQAFLMRCLAHPLFAAGGATTAFIAQHADALLRRDGANDQRALALAAALLLETSPGARHDAGRALSSPALSIASRFEVDGKSHAATLTRLDGHRHEVMLGGNRHDIDVVELAAQHVRFVCDGVMERAAWHRDGDRLWLGHQGVVLEVVDITRDAALRHAGPAGDGQLRASMNGRVVAVQVSVGQQVSAGQPVITLEAMKMEHVHAAPLAGTVKALHVSPGDQVAARRVVAEIDAAPPADAPAAAPAKEIIG
ncbi:MAG TPA: biotin/lipoyl-containing protein, partial [Burkholderiaceae bacterium]|nr:biotin/lipoyl-containing protein [Burkholderiaceae bacterium]